MRNPLHGEVIAIICQHFMLFIRVPMVVDNFTLWEEKDRVGQVPREVKVLVLEDVRDQLDKASSAHPELVVETPAVNRRVE